MPIFGSDSFENLKPNMTYCTQTDITDRKGTEKIAKLTGDPSGAEIDSAKVTSAIEEFASKIDAAVRKNYPDLPFDSTHKLLNGLNIEGAYLLLERDGRGWTDDKREEWKMIMKQVDDIAKGIIDLRSETEEQEEAMTEGFFSSNSRVFGRSRAL